MAASKTFAAPEPGALEQEITLDITVRVTTVGKREIVEAELRERFERELPHFLLPRSEIISVRKARR